MALNEEAAHVIGFDETHTAILNSLEIAAEPNAIVHGSTDGRRSLLAFVISAACAWLATGCGTPVGVRRLSL